MRRLADREWLGIGGAEGEERGAQLLVQGAKLGDPQCQVWYGWKCCKDGSAAQFDWIRRAALQGDSTAWFALRKTALEQVAVYEAGGSGRLLYEIGVTCVLSKRSHEDAATECAVAVYLRCNEEAKRAVMCWLWLGKNEGVAKDIRLLIADLIWNGRAAWADNCVGEMQSRLERTHQGVASPCVI